VLDFLLSHLTFWHWLVFGVLLLVVELVTGSGFMLWIAIGAFITSFVGLLVPNLFWPWQVFLFSCFSVVACFLWWRFLKKRTEKSDKPLLNQRTEQFVGKSYVLSEAIINGRGKVKVGDTHWVVEGDDMPAGQSVRVISAYSNVLSVEKIPSSD